MPKKKTHRPQGHYCKICGEYKANEKFSGKGHAAHICKSCSKLSAAEKAEAMTINRLMDLPMGRMSANDKNWLENRVHDRRPEVASLARGVYSMHFPYAERNERKKHLLINTLIFELNNVTVYDEFGDEYSIHMRFTANRLTNVLTVINFDADGAEQSITLEKKQMVKLLRWTVHTLEVFMWQEDYDLSPDDPFFDGPILDLLPEYWPEDLDEEDADEYPEDDTPEVEVRWRVQIEYADETGQEIISYQDHLFDKPIELLFALLEYFELKTDDLDDDLMKE
ncbi:MAG: hypothetical protein K2O45_09675 [Oscillospiraceae bacterium]|nr:hypothetical protein [Oscillospiraceae bacterium]